MAEQGTTYYEFVGKRLDAERNRTDRIDTRSTAVTTSSAALVSLLVALLALILGKDYAFATEVGRWAVLAALALFVLAAILSLVAGLLRKQIVPDKGTLESALGEHWNDTEVSARLACAWMDFDTLISLRKGNSKRTWWLDWSLRSQLVGAAALAVGFGWELYQKTS